MLKAILIVALVLMTGASPGWAQTRAACVPDTSNAASQAGTIARIDTTGDITLVDGRVLVPAQLYRPQNAPFVDWPAAQTPVTYIPVGNAPDRWGRQRARVTVHAAGPSAGKATESLWLEEEWLKRGLAITRPDGSDAPCLALLFLSEGEGRQTRQGIWTAPDAVGLADKPETLATRSGNYVLIEGVVQSIGERKIRTYLNFGTSWNEDTTVSIAKPVWTALASRGVTRKALEKRRIRVRGLLEMRGGPFITLLQADDIELLKEH